MPKMVDLTGQTFGRLKVLSKHPERSNNGSVQWLVKCECGTSEPFLIIGATMKSGNTTSCGCLRREKTGEKFRKHGLHGKPEYWIWVDMRKRCYNKNFRQYKDYGGRGIKLSDDWNESFENFYRDMGPRPSEQHSIDRIDNDGNYEKGNCRWTTTDVQRNNTRANVCYLLDGQEFTIAQLAKKFGFSYTTMRMRLLHLPVSAAIDKYVKFESFSMTIEGVTRTMREWLDVNKVSPKEYLRRREDGWSFSEAVLPILSKRVEVDGATETIEFWFDLFGVSEDLAKTRICRKVLDGEDFSDALKKHLS